MTGAAVSLQKCLCLVVNIVPPSGVAGDQRYRMAKQAIPKRLNHIVELRIIPDEGMAGCTVIRVTGNTSGGVGRKGIIDFWNRCSDQIMMPTRVVCFQLRKAFQIFMAEPAFFFCGNS